MRWFPALLLCAAAATAQENPFAPLDADFRPGIVVPGVAARLNESLALLKQAIEKRPADVDALERAMPLLKRLNRIHTFLPVLDRAFQVHDLSDSLRARLRSLRGRTRIESTIAFPNLVLPAGFNPRDLQRILDQLRKPGKAAANRARPDLESAVKTLPNDWQAREALAQVLTVLDAKQHKDRITRLRDEAAAMRVREQILVPLPVDFLAEIKRLREDAEQLEQMPKDPNHAAALKLRRQALILDYCRLTIPFEPELGLWKEVALLAPEHMVQENLTRTFRTKKGEIASVGVQYYRPPSARQIEVVAQLGKQDNSTAAAALLSVLRRARGEHPVAEAVVRAARGKAVTDGLPKLLATALFSLDEVAYSHYGRRMLVTLAGELALETAAPVLRKALALDNDLWVPLGVAAALGRIGRAEDADALLSTARNLARDVHFRREAAEALGRVAPDRLAALENIAELEITIAAARYRLNPNRNDLGRILTGLDRLHEADEAARYCADLKIREALPALERFLAERANHYAVQSVRRSHYRLLASLRGG